MLPRLPLRTAKRFFADDAREVAELLRHQVSLGLDLRGGSHLLLQVDMNTVEQERLNSLVDEVRTQLVAAKVGYSDLAATANHVSFTVRDNGRMKDVRDIVNKINSSMDVQIGATGTVTLTPNQAALIQRRNSAIDQSIEIVRRRIDETGTKEPTIQREGDDRILVQLPGVENPEHVKELSGDGEDDVPARRSERRAARCARRQSCRRATCCCRARRRPTASRRNITSCAAASW